MEGCVKKSVGSLYLQYLYMKYIRHKELRQWNIVHTHSHIYIYIYLSPNRIITVFMKAIIECVTRNNNIYPMGIKRELIFYSSQLINVELSPYFNLAHQSSRLMTFHGKWNRLIAYSQTQKSMVHTEHTLWYLIPIEWFGAPHIYV